MKLITVENYELKVADEALLVRPIRKLWRQDRSKGKERFYQQMSVLFYVWSPASNYAYIADEEERIKEVLEQEGIRDFRFTADFMEAAERYRKLNVTPSSVLLESTLIAIDKVSAFLKDVDLNRTDDHGKPIYTINSITSAIRQIPSLARDVQEAMRSISRELEEQGRARGSQELTIGDLE